MSTPDDARLERATELAARAAAPAISGNVLTGTAGWTDPSLVKSRLFYPRGTNTPQARLEHYARHFRLVEVDASYYTLIAPEVAARWLEWTPGTFLFDVKAHPILTGHPIDVRRLPSDLRAALAGRAPAHSRASRRGTPGGVERAREGGGGSVRASEPRGARAPVEDVEDAPARIYPDKLPDEIAAEIEHRFRDFVEPIHAAGRLGAVLVQLPPWATATRGNVRRLEAIAERWHGVPLAVEFRNKTWLDAGRRERVLDMLRATRAAYVVVDEPDVPLGGVPPVLSVTNPELAVVRFHGHNAGGWHRGASVAERFDYLYSPEELARWVAPVRALAAEAKTVHAVFNNCVRNQAVLGAQGLSVLLEEEAKG